MSETPEPNIVKGSAPEKPLREAISKEIGKRLEQKEKQRQISQFFLLEDFGLDIAVFIERLDGRSTVKFLELKAFVGYRPGGVGISKGSQVDLLLLDNAKLRVADKLSRWILVDGTKPLGSARFAIFTNTDANKAAMGGVEQGKHNNLRVADLMINAVTWDHLLKEMEAFLFL